MNPYLEALITLGVMLGLLAAAILAALGAGMILIDRDRAGWRHVRLGSLGLVILTILSVAFDSSPEDPARAKAEDAIREARSDGESMKHAIQDRQEAEALQRAVNRAVDAARERR